MATKVEITTNAYQTSVDPEEWEISRATPLDLWFNVTIEDGDAFVSSTIATENPDGGITIDHQDLSTHIYGTYQEQLFSVPPTYEYVSHDIDEEDAPYMTNQVPRYSDIPFDDPNFVFMSSYTSPDMHKDEMVYTHVLTYLTNDDESNSTVEKTIVTVHKFDLINNWTADVNAVNEATSKSKGGSKLPLSLVTHLTTGHDLYPPTPAVMGATKVFSGGLPVLKNASTCAPHTKIVPPHDTHVPILIGGSSKVYIEGSLAVRIADSGSCGGVMAQGSGKVFCA